jgi:uncharacterized membrane protein YphA (DoxX/SURF4 family)
MVTANADMAEPRYAWLLLRLVVGAQFVAAGAFSALQWRATVDFNATLTGSALAPAATALAIGLLIAGGTSVTLDYHARIGALLLLAFLIPASLRHLLVASEVTAHVPAASDLAALAKRGQLASFAKNLALMALVVFIAARGIGPPANKA